MSNIITFATDHGTMAIYKDNIHLFSKKKFTKVIKIMANDNFIWSENKAELLKTLDEQLISYKRMLDRNVTKLDGIKVENIIKNFEYYKFFIKLQ